ncbi:hypothetical protein ACZ90_65090 [Streptomyces albus subsp. albus]|nr:hypothetical protein ACZ90_65090 [Streptomyces albus subsp. albus]
MGMVTVCRLPQASNSSVRNGPGRHVPADSATDRAVMRAGMSWRKDLQVMPSAPGEPVRPMHWRAARFRARSLTAWRISECAAVQLVT